MATSPATVRTTLERLCLAIAVLDADLDARFPTSLPGQPPTTLAAHLRRCADALDATPMYCPAIRPDCCTATKQRLRSNEAADRAPEPAGSEPVQLPKELQASDCRESQDRAPPNDNPEPKSGGQPSDARARMKQLPAKRKRPLGPDQVDGVIERWKILQANQAHQSCDGNPQIKDDNAGLSLFLDSDSDDSHPADTLVSRTTSSLSSTAQSIVLPFRPRTTTCKDPAAAKRRRLNNGLAVEATPLSFKDWGSRQLRDRGSVPAGQLPRVPAKLEIWDGRDTGNGPQGQQRARRARAALKRRPRFGGLAVPAPHLSPKGRRPEHIRVRDFSSFDDLSGTVPLWLADVARKTSIAIEGSRNGEATAQKSDHALPMKAMSQNLEETTQTRPALAAKIDVQVDAEAAQGGHETAESKSDAESDDTLEEGEIRE